MSTMWIENKDYLLDSILRILLKKDFFKCRMSSKIIKWTEVFKPCDQRLMSVRNPNATTRTRHKLNIKTEYRWFWIQFSYSLVSGLIKAKEPKLPNSLQANKSIHAVSRGIRAKGNANNLV